MRRLFSFASLLFIAMVGILAVSGSSNLSLWAACLFGLPLIVWLAGGPRAYPVLLWILGICWLQIVCDVAVADLEGRVIADDFGAYSARAIIYSLCAMFAMAAGMRCAKPIVSAFFGNRSNSLAVSTSLTHQQFEAKRLLIAYFATAALVVILAGIAWEVPSLTQPIIAFTLVKYAIIYLLAVTVFEHRHGYAWLVLVAVFEILSGSVSFFAAYKEGIFVILIAFATARQRVSIRTVLVSTVAVAAVFWISIVWSLVKENYRSVMSDMTAGEKFEYMATRYFSDEIDYQRGFKNLLERIGYTTLYSKVLARQDAGIITADHDFYENAVIHVLTPRLFFPNKATLDDSALTTQLLGIQIDEDTSIGVGYVAEAQVDFGFPGLLVPLWFIGLLLGLAAEYFMTRPAPLHVRQAFMVAALFNCFSFAANIDKSFGGFVTGFLAMAVTLKFAYPFVEPWLCGLSLRGKTKSLVVRLGR